MTATFGTCPRHHIKYRGRCPKCHPRRSASSRPVSRRRQSAAVLDRLAQFEYREPAVRCITTADIAGRWLRRTGRTWMDLTDAEYVRLLSRASETADRLNSMFRAPREPSQP